MLDKAKYYSLLNIFSQSPYTLSSSSTYSASVLSRFLSIADTTLLRKTGSKIVGKKTVLAHRAPVISLS